MRFVLLLLCYFLFIFAPIVGGIDILFITAFILCVYGIFAYGFSPLMNNSRFLYILFPVFIYALLNAALLYTNFEGNDAFFLIFKPIRILVTVIGAYVLTRITKDRYGTDFDRYCITFVFISIFIHAGIMGFESINPSFRSLLQNTLFYGHDTRGSWNEQYRMGGLMGVYGGAITSIVQSVGVLLLPFILKYYKTTLSKVIIIGMSAIILYSVLVSGRSGLWCVFVFIPFIIYKLNPQSFTKTLLLLGATAIVVFVGMNFLISYTVSDSDGNAAVQTMFSRTFDSFINSRSSGSFEDATVSTLWEMVLFPDFVTFFMGNASHMLDNDFGRALQSDIGYIRNLWSLGILGLCFYLKPYLRMLKKVRLSKNIISICSITLILVTLFFEMKEMVLYCRCLLSITALIYFAAIIVSNSEINELQKY